MLYSARDITERRDFVERSIELTHVALQRSDVLGRLGLRAAGLLERLETAFVPDITDGTVTIDDPYDDALPIFAVRPEESLTIGRGLGIQDARQKQATLLTFKQWKPMFGDTDLPLVYDALAGESGEGILTLGEGTDAKVGNNMTLHTVGKLAGAFAAGPKKGLIGISRRPSMALMMRPDQVNAPPFIVVHELVHDDQYRREPVRLLRSKNNATMQGLRQEAEAYDIGSELIDDEAFRTLSEDSLTDTEKLALAHLLVNVIRRTHIVDPTDPYKPSGALLRDLSE